MPVQPLNQIDHTWLTLGLLALMLLAIEIGCLLGRRARARSDDGARTQITALEGAMLGVLGLLLAFSFSMAGSRFEGRRQLVVREANAIGTAYLRASILPKPQADEMRTMLRDYTDLRIELVRVAHDVPAARQVLERTAELQQKIWDFAILHTTGERGGPMSGLVLGPINEMIDLGTSRLNEALSQVPKVITGLLTVVSLIAMGLVGFATGHSRRRNAIATTLFAMMIAAVFWVCLDLDRPRRGLITISQAAMEMTRSSMK